MPRVSYQKVPKSPKVFPSYGKGKCVYCGKTLPKYKRKYCCNLHELQYRIESSECLFVTWDEVRSHIFNRDEYTCKACGYKFDRTKGHITDQIQCDHIVPIALGGDEFHPSNLQTLCVECHKIKTCEDVSKMVETRHAEADKLQVEQERLRAEQEATIRRRNDRFWQSQGIAIE